MFLMEQINNRHRQIDIFFNGPQSQGYINCCVDQKTNIKLYPQY